MTEPNQLDWVEIGRRLTAKRNSFFVSGKRITQSELAEMVGVHRDYISKIEKAERVNPSQNVMYALASVLGVELYWLLGLSAYEGDKTPMEGALALDGLEWKDRVTMQVVRDVLRTINRELNVAQDDDGHDDGMDDGILDEELGV